jgi:hypothetical protein
MSQPPVAAFCRCQTTTTTPEALAAAAGAAWKEAEFATVTSEPVGVIWAGRAAAAESAPVIERTAGRQPLQPILASRFDG